MVIRNVRLATEQETADLPIRRAVDLDPGATSTPWLIDQLWGVQGAGMIGAEPKCCKTWLALDMAVSVASGTPCLRKFEVPAPGPVIYFPAEDAEHIVRSRIAGIAASAGVDFADLDLHIITAASLYLDEDKGRDLLRRLIEHVRPKLLVLDPFVRMHRGDENSASSVSEVLGFLRSLQRSYACAVLLVHHMKKTSGSMRPGQALRGSGDLHAFGDSNLFLARREGKLLLTAEHRAAEGFAGMQLELRSVEPAIALHATDHLEVIGDAESSNSSPSAGRSSRRDLVLEVFQALQATSEPMSQRRLRTYLGARMANVNAALRDLEANGKVSRTARGYRPLAGSDGVPKRS